MTSSPEQSSYRVNLEIRVPRVFVEVEEGPVLGIMPTADALSEARRRGLDLVLASPLAEPPGCEIRDISRYIYNDELAAQFASAPVPGSEPMSTLPIPDTSKSFLAATGLPERFCEFRLDYDRAGLVRLDVYVEWCLQIERLAYAKMCRRLAREPFISREYVSPNPVDLSRYYRLGGMDVGMTVTIEVNSGRVMFIDIAGMDGYSPPQFVNSDVMRFGQFIRVFESANDSNLTTVRAQLAALDPKAMEDQDHGAWSDLLEELEGEMSPQGKSPD
jgi:hypothetical protein